MTVTGTDQRPISDRVREPTPASAWHAVSGGAITDDLLEWPPDVFALMNVVLAKAEAFRFALVPLGAWPPSRYGDWADAVGQAGVEWSRWVNDRTGELPEVVAKEWMVFREGAETPLELLATGGDSRMSEALLTLHAIADEACAGLGLALDTSDADACRYRARGRELLARRGSIARIDPRMLRVLPKVRTPPTGRPAFSRYAAVHGPGTGVRWHKIPARHPGTDLRSEYATILLLPWPLSVHASDFRAVEGSVQRPTNDPFGFFLYSPHERIDLDLLDRVLLAARQEAGSVDVVVLPESAVDASELDDVEAVLNSHGVISLVTGVRDDSWEGPGFPSNWMHIGMNPRLQKGTLPTAGEDPEPWFHIRQNKHHRWSLDQSQIEQYHLGAALHPHVRWWEAMEVPRRSIEVVEVAELTLTALVCEDLAQNDEIAQLIRSIGPTAVIAVLLDGPQLSSRWAARYASVLADDPGSSVLTLTSFGMVDRSRTRRHGEASRVIALWKDSATGVREIPLEPGAHGVVLTLCTNLATRRSADGRRPIDSGTYCFNAAVSQVRASSAGSGLAPPRSSAPTSHVLETEELTVLTAWAEGVAESAAYAPERIDELLDDASAGASWRAALGVPEPSPRLADAIDALARVVRAAEIPTDAPLFDELLAALRPDKAGEGAVDGLVRRALLAMLEERETRRPWEAHASN